ncbi:hypothetical protein N0V90_005391 [Kalmusia sp. IMI 367209]|nr:hypothetical protein N0V90_005391 [Kalmusia sp. IMI 367209]
MATVVEQTSEGTVYRSAQTHSLPDVDILTLLFDPETKLHISAADPSLSLTVSRTRTLTEATSSALRRHFGIGANGAGQDIVSVISNGHFLLPVLVYGIIGAEGVLSAASTAGTVSDVSKQLLGAESKILICTESTKYVALNAAEEAGWGRNGGGRVLIMGEGKEWSLKAVQPNFQLGPNLIDENQRLPWKKITDPDTLDNSLVILIYSSGTTGLPKGVKLSHRNFVAQTAIPGDNFKHWIKTQNPDFEYRTVAHLPTAHIGGIQNYIFAPFYMGGTVYWMSKFVFPEFLEYNKKYQTTYLFSVPPIWLRIAQSPEVTDQFQTLQVTMSGAAPLGKDLQHAASEKLGGPDCFISSSWGLSETTGSATIRPLDTEHDHTGSVSPLMSNVRARLVDDEGKDVEPGTPGEVLLQGPVVFKGYHKNDEANRQAFVDGWFHTGDVAEFRNGLFYIVDRKKELIKFNGMQVAPAELEALLLSHEDILDAAVIGIEVDDGRGELPRAYVVADETKISEEDIKAWVKSKVANHKQLRGGVVFLKTIPKSPSGKILRKDLRHSAKTERSVAQLNVAQLSVTAP